MTHLKSYTSPEQSKVLAKILPLESADMWWTALNWQETEYYVEVKQDGINQPKRAIPCWSLASLLVILAKIASKIDDDGSADLLSFMGQWSVNMFDCQVEATDNYDNSVDACYEMIIKLNELNLI